MYYPMKPVCDCQAGLKRRLLLLLLLLLLYYLVCRVFPIRDVPVRLSDEQDDAGQRADEEQSGGGDAHDRQLDEVFVGLS